MTDKKDPGQEKAREAEAAKAAKAKEKEGSGAVQNVSPGQAEGEEGELKEALHKLEEEKGDWAD